MRALIIHEHGNTSIHALREHAAVAGIHLSLATPEQLLLGDGFCYRSTRSGEEVWCSSKPKRLAPDLVVNLSIGAFELASTLIVQKDVEYTQAELHALLVGVVSSFRCPVINAPRSGLIGGWRTMHEWTILAMQSDLACARRVLDCSSAVWRPNAARIEMHRPVAVFRGRVFGECPTHLHAPLRTFQRRSEFDLLEVVFDCTPERWAFVHISTTPDLRSYSNELLDSLWGAR